MNRPATGVLSAVPGDAGHGDTAPPPLGPLRVRFGEQLAEVIPGTPFSIGRDADINIDENPY
ncbi:hypothetical protein, partial [Mesorhizobium japonicum]|uniref:hypothetical protein n=1 Tax=Mesorhizobium japonicum TaxID=2066070 RepID=UPI003B5CBC6F